MVELYHRGNFKLNYMLSETYHFEEGIESFVLLNPNF
jgi:hypothetical protein